MRYCYRQTEHYEILILSGATVAPTNELTF